MITDVFGNSAVIISVALMPSMSGMLMSIKITSGCSRRAITRASVPLPAMPTTSRSRSNMTSLLICSRASTLSSTITRRIFGSLDMGASSWLLDQHFREHNAVVFVHNLIGDAGRPLDIGVVLRAQGQADNAVLAGELDHFGLLVGDG